MQKKQLVSTLVSICFGSPWLKHTMKTNCMKLQTVDPVICSNLILSRGSGASFITIFCAWFLKKNVNWSNFIVWLLRLFEISGNMCIVIVCYPNCDVINLMLTFTFLSSRFSTWTKSEQKLKYLKNEKSF